MPCRLFCIFSCFHLKQKLKFGTFRKFVPDINICHSLLRLHSTLLKRCSAVQWGALHCTALHCTALHRTARHCLVLYNRCHGLWHIFRFLCRASGGDGGQLPSYSLQPTDPPLPSRTLGTFTHLVAINGHPVLQLVTWHPVYSALLPMNEARKHSDCRNQWVIPWIPGKCRNQFFLLQFFIFQDRY